MDKVIQLIIRRAKRDVKVLALALFGSYARGEAYRDIDICIILKPGVYSPEELAKKRLEYAQEEEKYDVQVFQQLPLYVRARLLKEMKILYCRNENTLYDLCFQNARDFTHFRPMYEGYLEAMAHG